MRHLLVTGGSGFIGSHYIRYFLDKDQELRVINLDNLTYASNSENLSEVESNPRYTFVQGNICDRSLVTDILKKYSVDGIVHFAAESHVDRSLSSPECFIESNIVGTFSLLEAARNVWDPKDNKRFHHVSTDEVYGSLDEISPPFTEKSPYHPNSPYSASKASSDHIVRSYHVSYGMNVVITHCSNNYGPMQHDEKFIPTVIRTALNEQPIPIYGNGENIRDWIHVQDHCIGLGHAFDFGVSGETYNLGGDCEEKNIDICKMICTLLDQKSPRNSGKSYHDLITFVSDRPGHDFRYAICSEKIYELSQWEPQFSFEEGLEQTVQHYLEKYQPTAILM